MKRRQRQPARPTHRLLVERLLLSASAYKARDNWPRKALVVAAENVPGVKAVRDHLAWVDPNSGMVFYQSDEEPAQAKAS